MYKQIYGHVYVVLRIYVEKLDFVRVYDQEKKLSYATNIL